MCLSSLLIDLHNGTKAIVAANSSVNLFLTSFKMEWSNLASRGDNGTSKESIAIRMADC